MKKTNLKTVFIKAVQKTIYEIIRLNELMPIAKHFIVRKIQSLRAEKTGRRKKGTTNAERYSRSPVK